MIDRSSKSDSRDRDGLPNDLMSELLLCLRLNGVYCRRLHVSPPFGIRFDAVPGRAQFHFVANGEAFLRLTSGAVHRLAAGDAVLLPHGSTADLVSAPNLPATVQTRLHAMTPQPRETGRSPERLGGGQRRQPPDQTTHVFSGCMAFDLGSLRPLIKEMPEVMLIGRLIDRQPEIDALLQAMEREVLAERIGSGGVLAHIAGVISAYIVRDWVEFGCKEGRSHDAGRWLGTLRDPRLGRVIGALHRDPGRDWTVAELATMTGISRSALPSASWLSPAARRCVTSRSCACVWPRNGSSRTVWRSTSPHNAWATVRRLPSAAPSSASQANRPVLCGPGARRWRARLPFGRPVGEAAQRSR